MKQYNIEVKVKNIKPSILAITDKLSKYLYTFNANSDVPASNNLVIIHDILNLAHEYNVEWYTNIFNKTFTYKLKYNVDDDDAAVYDILNSDVFKNIKINSVDFYFDIIKKENTYGLDGICACVYNILSTYIFDHLYVFDIDVNDRILKLDKDAFFRDYISEFTIEIVSATME